MTVESELEQIRRLAQPLRDPDDLGQIVHRIGEARHILLGEASHGTSEFYSWRATLTERLIANGQVSFVAVEGDWPDCFALNRWVKDHSPDAPDVHEALARFARWPTWMWANEEVASFLEWLRHHNRSVDPDAQVGFYGLDVYSLWDSLRCVQDYLVEHRPDAIDAALEALRCFDPYGEDPQRYARATRFVPHSCEEEVVGLLAELRANPPRGDGAESSWNAVQNAQTLVGAERYYRTMVQGGGESWNVRDLHMADTLDRLAQWHDERLATHTTTSPGRSAARTVVWAHNTHVGDARATDMAAAGMFSLGQLVRERHGTDDTVLVGFAGYNGSVIAGDAWGSPARRMTVPDAPVGTHEHMISEVTTQPTVFVFPQDRSGPWLSARRGHRAIGVVYRPERDAFSNWAPTVMGRRYDALVSFGSTEALRPTARFTSAGAERETEPWGT